MENIYIPLDFSNLREFLPPNEKIIYSSLCTIKYRYAYDVGFNPLALLSMFQPTRNIKQEKIAFNSHLLITTRGFAYFCQPLTVIEKKPVRLPQIPTYNTLLNIDSVSNTRIKALHSDIFNPINNDYRFELQRHPNFESETTFKQRIKNFKLSIYPYILETLESMLNYVQENRDKEEKDDTPLWQLDKNLISSYKDKEWSKNLLEYINDLTKTGVPRKKINFLEFLTQLGGKSQIAYIIKAINPKIEIIENKIILRNGTGKYLFDRSYIRNLKSRIGMIKHDLEFEKKIYQKRQKKLQKKV